MAQTAKNEYQLGIRRVCALFQVAKSALDYVRKEDPENERLARQLQCLPSPACWLRWAVCCSPRA